MSLEDFLSPEQWAEARKRFFDSVDNFPHQYIAHIFHGAQILAYKHPDPRFREAWGLFYQEAVSSLHLGGESEEEMDRRLSDWDQELWDGMAEENANDLG
jgi:hypothetical protein